MSEHDERPKIAPATAACEEIIKQATRGCRDPIVFFMALASCPATSERERQRAISTVLPYLTDDEFERNLAALRRPH